jgi:DNA replication protein DnaC
MKKVDEKMTELRLHGMKTAWNQLKQSKTNPLSLDEGLELLLQAEADERVNRKYYRLQNAACFRYKASIEEIKTDPARGINKELVALLRTGEYLSKGDAVLITGATGCGKSFLGSALGNNACMQGFKVLYFNVQKLMLKTKLSRSEGTILTFFDKLAKADLLILDDFGLTHLDKQQQIDLMEIIEDRHAKKATIIISQLPVKSWYDIIGEETIADAILDRLIHSSYKIDIKGDSLRKKM